MTKIFDVGNVAMVEVQLQNLRFPYVYVYHSTLGGADNVSILLTVSLDPKHTWSNGILQNSRYAQIHISNNGVVEQFSGSRLKLRKFTAKNISQIIEKINNIKEK